MTREPGSDPAASAPALRRLPDADRTAFVARAEARIFEPGEFVFREGERAEEIFLILRGAVWLRKRIDESETSSLALQSDLEWLGEMPLDGPCRRSASAVAETRVQTLSWERKTFAAMVDEHPSLARDLLAAISQHVRDRDAALVDALRKRTHELLAADQRHDRPGRKPPERIFERFAGQSTAAVRVRRDAERVAQGNGPALLIGEAGSGRSLVARCIHDASHGPDAPFSRLDATNAADGWLEAQLLGSADGGNLAGVPPGPGLLERSDGGTLYVDSIDELSPPLQSVLVRFLGTGRFEMLGEIRPRESRVRVLASISGDPEARLRDGRLRGDLLGALDRSRVELPPLRTRRSDIPLLAARRIAELGRAQGVAPLTLAPSALGVLSRYDFPGNLYELDAELELLYATLEPGSRVTSRDLGPRFVQGDPSTAAHYSEAVRAFKAQLISNAVHEADGNRARAAERLGLHRSNLTRMIRDLGLDSVL